MGWGLEEADDTSALTEALEEVTEAEHPDEGCEEAIAAAEVVAAMLGKPLAELPEEVTAYLKQQSSRKPSADLVKLAAKAVRRIAKESDFKDPVG